MLQKLNAQTNNVSFVDLRDEAQIENRVPIPVLDLLNTFFTNICKHTGGVTLSENNPDGDIAQDKFNISWFN